MNWKKAEGCEAGTCVEVAVVGKTDNQTIGIRNNRVPGEVIWVDMDEWKVFIEGVKNGDFDNLA